MLTLQDLCLQIIVDGFERYHKLYSTTDDVSVSRMFEYLQRKHSEYLLEHLQARDEIKEEYIDFLISKFLKVLDTQWFKNCAWTTVISKVKEIGSNIRKLNVEDYSAETPWQDIICCLPNLQFFSFKYGCRDAILENIPKFCPNILEINVEKSRVTNEGLKYLCTKENDKTICSRLKKLSIASTPVNNAGVEQLIKYLPSLEVLDYLDLPRVIYSMHKDDLLSLDKVVPYNIVELDLLNFARTPFFTDLLNVCLFVCPHLKDLKCPLLNEEHLKFFSKLSDLEILHLECLSDSEIDINSILKSKGSNLTSLTAVSCIISVSILSQSCPRLKDIWLNKVTFLYNEDSKPVFHRLESCTFEYLTNDPTTTKAASLLLSSCPKLENLLFRRCNVSSPEIKKSILECCKCNPVENIIFFSSVVEIEFVKDVLLSCHSLKKLHLDECGYNWEHKQELLIFAGILPNNPCITVSDELSSSDDDDDSVQSSYGFDDEFYGDSDYYYDYDPSDEDYGYF